MCIKGSMMKKNINAWESMLLVKDPLAKVFVLSRHLKVDGKSQDFTSLIGHFRVLFCLVSKRV